VAHDPLARGQVPGILELPAYRYQHAGYPFLSWILALGRPGLIAWTMIVVNLLAVLMGTYGAARFLEAEGRRARWAVVYGLSPGLIAAVALDTSEALAMAFCVWGLLAYRRGRPVASALWLAGASLTKEIFVLVALALLVYHLWQRRNAWPMHRLLPYLLPFFVPAVWSQYLRTRIPGTALQGGFSLAPPFVGILRTLRMAADHAFGSPDQMQLAFGQIPLLAALLALSALGVVRALRHPSLAGTVFLAFAALFTLLDWWALLYPKDLWRILAPLLVLLPLALASEKSPAVGSPQEYATSSAV